jgi:DNA-binding transcriptional LysR family regulator
VQRFLKAHPGVNVQVTYRHAREVYEDVLSNISDLGLVAYPWKDSHLEILQFRKEPMVLICAPDHPFAKRKSLKLDALAREKLVMFEAGIPTRTATDRALRDKGITPHPVMEFDNIETLKRAVEIGAGVAIVPQPAVVQEIADGTLAQVRLEEVDLERPLGIVHKRNKVLSPALKQFIALLRKES